MRSGWKKGDWLVIDEESGVVTYASRTRKDFKGNIVRKRWADAEQPQDFIKAKSDPYPLPFSNSPDNNQTIANFVPVYVGNTTVPTFPYGVANHLYDPGIGEMQIGYNFFVR